MQYFSPPGIKTLSLCFFAIIYFRYRTVKLKIVGFFHFEHIGGEKKEHVWGFPLKVKRESHSQLVKKLTQLNTLGERMSLPPTQSLGVRHKNQFSNK